MLTLNQVDKFLTTNLRFPNWKQVLETNKLDFLRLFLRKHVTYLPYQNVTISSFCQEERHNPGLAEIIADGISGKAGVCVNLNHFAKLVLDTIGFDTIAVEADCPLTVFPGDHYVVVVKLDGEQYMVDVGMIHPLYDIVPLDPAKLPYRDVMMGYPYEYRYSKETDTYSRVHILGGCNNGRFKDKDEVIFINFNLTPKKLEDFDDTMSKVYSFSTSFILRTFVITGYLELSDEEMLKKDANPGYVFIQGPMLIIGDRTTRKEIDFRTYDQIVPSIMKYFPMVIPEEVEKAIDTYTKFAENNPNFKDPM